MVSPFAFSAYESPADLSLTQEISNDSTQGVLTPDERIGVFLAISSSAFIGASFIIKKKGLLLAGTKGSDAGDGGYGYLMQPVWWFGLFTMIVGETANFVAYAYAPPIMVTPLGALTIIVSAILADLMLGERLSKRGWLGCLFCIIGSVVIVLSAPEEREIASITEFWTAASEPAFKVYAAITFGLAAALSWGRPQPSQQTVIVLVAICSLMGSMSVMACKALGTSIKLSMGGDNQLLFKETWYAAALVAGCISTQMNYLNKALAQYNPAVVTPVYFVLFTTLTLAASFVLFKDWERTDLATCTRALLGFATTVAGVLLLTWKGPGSKVVEDSLEEDAEEPTPKSPGAWHGRAAACRETAVGVFQHAWHRLNMLKCTKCCSRRKNDITVTVANLSPKQRPVAV
jgi:drug/metabolite transporter (DMT)-like permease